MEKQILYLCSEENPNPNEYRYSVSPAVVNIENSNSVTLDELRIEMAVSSGIIIESGNLFGEIPGWGISMVSKKGLAYLLRFEMRADSYQHGRGSAFVQW